MKSLGLYSVWVISILSLLYTTLGYSLQLDGWTEGEKGSDYAVIGEATADSGGAIGVIGLCYSPDGAGLSGYNSALQGDAIAIKGATGNSPNGIAISAVNQSKTGKCFGIIANTNSPEGVSILGTNKAASGDAIGILGKSYSPQGIAILGKNISTESAGMGIGVQGETNSNRGSGIVGMSNATHGRGYGVVGLTNTLHGSGVRGENRNIEALGYGAAGLVYSENATALKGINTADSGDAIGVYGFGKYPGEFSGGQGIVIPILASDPRNPRDGTIWLNSTTERMKIRVNGKTYSLKINDKAGGA